MPSPEYRAGLEEAIREHPDGVIHYFEYLAGEDRWSEEVFSEPPGSEIALLPKLAGAIEALGVGAVLRESLLGTKCDCVCVILRKKGTEWTQQYFEEQVIPNLLDRERSRYWLVGRTVVGSVFLIVSILEGYWPKIGTAWLEMLQLSTVKNLLERACESTVEPVTHPVESSIGSDYERFSRVGEAIQEALKEPTEEFRKLLADVEGNNYGSLAENRRIAGIIQETADKLRVSFACIRCGESSRFRCSEDAKVKTGVFVFSHGRHTHGGTATIPKLTIAPLIEGARAPRTKS